MPNKKMLDFCQSVNEYVLQHYAFTDGGNLCFNLMESGVIPEDATVQRGARIVAQHLQQA